MDKVKITQEQADAIEFGLNVSSYYDGNKDLILLDHRVMLSIPNSDNLWLHEMAPLNDMDFVTLSDALHIGYEIAGVNHD